MDGSGGDKGGDDGTQETVRRWMTASKIGRLGVMSALIAEQPALLNAKDVGGLRNTALHWAAAKNNLTIVTFLVDNGADVDLKNSSGAVSYTHLTLPTICRV